jgi:hypothetical protein
MHRDYQLSKGERGKFADRLANLERFVVLDPDVAPLFPTSKAVNDALRAVAAERTRKAQSKRRGSGGT